MNKTFTDDTKRLFWNVVKGIGIISIVVGHCCGFSKVMTRFVYLYHLPLFFFVSGFLYSEKKYGDIPHANVAARLRTCWPKYVGYMWLYILLHNAFLKNGIIVNSSHYGTNDVLIAGASAITFSAAETMGGALWFVPVLIVASGIFGCVIYAGRRAELLFGKKWIKFLVIILLTALVGAVGVYTNQMGMYFTWHIQTSFVVLPLFSIAWLINNYITNWDRGLYWPFGCLACFIMIYGVRSLNWGIELAANTIMGPAEFYLITILGIYFCLTLAKYLMNVPKVGEMISIFGQYSFDIMAGHFVAFKLVDAAYAHIISETNMSIYGMFPVAYSSKLWPIYIVAGVLLPTFFAEGLRRLKGIWKR